MEDLGPVEPAAPVSVIMPVRGEEATLAAAVTSVLDNGYEGEVELAIAVAPGPDRTREIADALAAADPRITVVGNPGLTAPHGLNAAIAATRHDVVVRMDGHAVMPPGYLALAVDALRRTGAANVGGRMVPEAEAPLARAIAEAMQSRFGIGGAGHRVGGEEGPADSVFLGAFRRAALEEMGGYDVHFTRAQDWELNHRLREAGYVVWFVPDMQVPYAPRGSWRALARQFHQSGRWRREVVTRYPSTASVRYLLPPVLLIGLVASTLLGIVGALLGVPLLIAAFLVPLAYALGLVVASVLMLPRTGAASAVLMPGVLGVMHLTWGAGFVRGIHHARLDGRG
ncbi:glycosyltransferase family 2 protein [Demequina zhanjiangensis]|uniref:Glycosyltransferase family 2 protein n=1 Tax=Demequina zhanjiangensis TaxID=3051659 RepID=A0ABT8FXN8_9MICO|nr:glycosyltransferase family 2 protein [Demequina sp. SYSU T00b26]MDN4471671.1 glycosyltransferase family 2 protein [Demequina sp. SYSU T00b26]